MPSNLSTGRIVTDNDCVVLSPIEALSDRKGTTSVVNGGLVRDCWTALLALETVV